MTLRIAHRYAAEATDREGRRLGELVLVPDFAPAAEWSHWHGVRQGLPARSHHGPGHVEPVFDPTLGQPYVSGIRVRLDGVDPANDAPPVTWRYFRPAVENASAQMVRAGTLKAGESFNYRICAYPLDEGTTAQASTEDDDPAAPLALGSSPLAYWVSGATHLCRGAWHDQDFPVFVHPMVLDQVAELARTAGDHETGGVLIGHLHRDTQSREVFAEVTAQIPASLADAGHAHLGFTAETWSAVSDALTLRRRHELWMGWWHSHPDFCARCAPERRRNCPLSQPFFSRADCEVHRTVFDAAFHIALLLSDVGEGSLRADWFGWREGQVAARGVYLMPGDTVRLPAALPGGEAPPAARVLNVEEDRHEQ